MTFQKDQAGTTIKVTYGSSGNFFAQLQNRAPFDVYFSADIDYPRRLAVAGHALDTNVFLYDGPGNHTPHEPFAISY